MKKILMICTAFLFISGCATVQPPYRLEQIGTDKVEVRGVSLREQDGHLMIQGLLFQPGIRVTYQMGIVAIEVYDPQGKLIEHTQGRYSPPRNAKKEWRFTGVKFHGRLEKVPDQGSIIRVSFGEG